MVLLGFQTISEGEQYLITKHSGQSKVIEGPCRITLFRSKKEKLIRYTANDDQYLEIRQTDGKKMVIPGPCSMFYNPILHDEIKRCNPTMLSASEAAIIYRINKINTVTSNSSLVDNNKPGAELGNVSKHPPVPSSKDVERIIIRGPTQYIVQPNEWMHEFKWHGSAVKPDGEDDKTKKVPGALCFNVLRIIADQFYYNVHDVRTKDDTLLNVKLMIFFEIKEIEKMLDNTHDPIGDFINNAASDVVAFCASLNYEQFLEKTGDLNNIETFPQLTGRAVAIGYKINKVVFRGFHSSEALQTMHDKAIHERTRLRLENENEIQKQRVFDFQLEKQEERASKQRLLESQTANHKHELELAEHQLKIQKIEQEGQAKLALKKKEEEHNIQFTIEKLQQEGDAKLELSRKQLKILEEEKQIEMNTMTHLKDLGVELTAYLVSQQRVPDKHYKFDTSSGNESMMKPGTMREHQTPIQVHLHE